MKLKNLLRLIILFFGYFILIFGLWSGILVATGGFTFIDGIINIFFLLLAGYSYLFFPIIIILMIRLHKGKKFKSIPIILGTAVVILNMLPMFGIPYSINQANSQFSDVFGSDYLSHIPTALKNKYQDQPFDFWSMYNFYSNFECNISYDEGPYLKNSYNDSFYFDYYSPKFIEASPSLFSALSLVDILRLLVLGSRPSVSYV